MLHGEEDGVVPPDIAREFLREIKEDAPLVPVDSKFYPGEGHHFHQKDHIEDALEREYDWYTKHLL